MCAMMLQYTQYIWDGKNVLCSRHLQFAQEGQVVAGSCPRHPWQQSVNAMPGTASILSNPDPGTDSK